MKLTRYIRKIAPVAAITTMRKRWVTLITPVRYSTSMTARTDMVPSSAWKAMPGYIDSNSTVMAPRSTPSATA